MEQFFLVFSAAVKVTVFTGKTCIAAFVKALRMQCMSNFPDYQGQHTEQNQCEGEYIGKEDQKAVLEEGVPVVDSAFSTDTRGWRERSARTALRRQHAGHSCVFP